MEEKMTKAQIKEQRKQERQQMEDNFKKQETRNKFKKTFFWILGICILVLGFWGLIELMNTPTEKTPEIVAPKVTDSDLSFGPKTAKLTLVEYADFQCPSCAYAYPMVKQLLKDYDGKIRYIYRFFPLTNIHKNAQVSAQAGYAAYLQGKFLEMQDILFTKQNDWAESDNAQKIFNQYASLLGLDMNQFTQDSNSDNTKKFIGSEEDAGVTAGVNSTPSFFVNGKYITNPQSYDDLKKVIDQALK